MIGIYKITNLKNGKFYIGSSSNIMRRWQEHCSLIEKKKHYNHLLQDAFDKYGFENFSFNVIRAMPKDTTKEKLLKEEQRYLNELKPYINDIGYNLSDTAYKDISNMYYVVTDDELLNIVLSDDIREKLKLNINTITNIEDKLISKYKDKFCLSSSYIASNPDIMPVLGKDIYNYLKNRVGSSKENPCYWTCNHNYIDNLNIKRFKKSWLPYNVRNVRQKRNNLVFAINHFPNDFVIRSMDFDDFDKQKYTLCVIVGWICSVADIDKPINIYIPSKRMRDVLLNWLNGGEL